MLCREWWGRIVNVLSWNFVFYAFHLCPVLVSGMLSYLSVIVVLMPLV